MSPWHDHLHHLTRRTFIGRSARGIGGIALGSMLSSSLAEAVEGSGQSRGVAGLPHFAPKAKRVLCLFQSGGLSHVDLFDDKPMLHKFAGTEIPASVKGSQRLTGMTSGQSAYPIVPPLKSGRRAAATEPGSVICCPTSSRSRTTSASSRACTPRRSTTTRPSPT
jgi:hypothetical protein